MGNYGLEALKNNFFPFNYNFVIIREGRGLACLTFNKITLPLFHNSGVKFIWKEDPAKSGELQFEIKVFRKIKETFHKETTLIKKVFK